MSSKDFLSALTARRTNYALSPASPIPDSRIQEIVEHAVKHSPSAFNSQSSRAVVVLGEEHRKVWGFVQEALKSLIGEGAYKAGSEARLKGFEGSYGTVLLFEDKAVVKGLQDGMPTYADKFPQWADHAHGILANNIWTAFTLEGLGANLQHYNPLPDKSITDNFSLPESWELKAQLVFGQPAAAPGEKTFKPLEERVKIFGDK